jgi:hypothetical protein
MTFQDLEFAPHANGMKGAVQAKLELPNGIVISVVGGGGLYGNGIETFEVGAWHKEGHEWIQLSEFDDVVGWQDKDDITAIIKKLID